MRCIISEKPQLRKFYNTVKADQSQRIYPRIAIFEIANLNAHYRLASQGCAAVTAHSVNLWCLNLWCLNLWCLNLWCLNLWCLNLWCLNLWCLNLWCLNVISVFLTTIAEHQVIVFISAHCRLASQGCAAVAAHPVTLWCIDVVSRD
jgi:hypothetical protein